MTSSSRPANKRLPISCQACRTRKIRCSRDGRPCQTCIRRGLGAEDCIYLGQPRLSSEGSLTADAKVQNELLARIRNLEDLLHKQCGLQANDLLSPQTSPSTAGSFSECDSVVGLFPGEARSPIIGNIGALQTFASGYVRYLPLASPWNSAIPMNSKSSPLQDIDNDIPEDDDDLHIPLAKNNLSRKELLAALPPGRYCDALKDVYFRVFSPLFHILHDLTFEAEYQQFCHDPNSVTTAWIALLFAILGIAVTALDDNDPLLSDLGRERTVSRNVKVLSARYRSTALRCLAADGVLSRHSISTLQSLILVNYARLHRGLPTWTLLGLTHHVAISMGCHVDPDRFALGAIEREERRRAWAGLTMLYSVQSTSFGSIDNRFQSQDVKPPLDINDVDLLTGTAAELSARPTQMTFLILEHRLHKASSMIYEALFSFPSRYTVSQIENEILVVHETCDQRYQLDTALEPLPTHHLANLNILYSYIHQLFLLLLRPSLCRYLQGEITPETCSARAKCVASAKASLTIHHLLFDSPQFSPYAWYSGGLGSFHAFHAAVVLSVILLYPENQFEATEIKALLWKSLEVFASLSNRSNFCSKAVPVLRHIVNAACARSQQPTVPVDPSSAMITPTPTAFIPSFSSTPMGSISEPLFAQLHPRNWVNPGCVPWDGWDFLSQPKQFSPPGFG